ncbi:MAG TPA: ester cyclase [Chitinophagaceae bacterium]|nr:ester cyclase [Chitinophagaceae bacterium]
MKKLITAILLAATAASCTNNGGSASATTADSTLAAWQAKDSIMQKNKATALAALVALNNGYIDSGFSTTTPDAVDYGNGTYPPTRGKDSIIAGFKAFFTAFPDSKGSNFQVFGHGNTVVVLADWTGTFKNAFMGNKPTGKSYHYPDADIFTFNNAGMIIAHRSIQSNQVLDQQVGIPMKK